MRQLASVSNGLDLHSRTQLIAVALEHRHSHDKLAFLSLLFDEGKAALQEQPQVRRVGHCEDPPSCDHEREHLHMYIPSS